MSMQLITTISTLRDAYAYDIHVTNERVADDMQKPYEMTDAEWDAMEQAYDAQQLERATYHGMTEAEFLARYPDDDEDDRSADDKRPLPCEYRFTDWYADECWSGNCTLAAQELADAIASEPPQPRISPEAMSRPFWRVKALWSRLTHR